MKNLKTLVQTKIFSEKRVKRRSFKAILKQLMMGTLLGFGLFLTSSLSAQDGAELFKRLTCETCHGVEGRGMFRQETKATYRLKTKHLTVLKNAGFPKSMLKKLLKLRKEKFTNETDFMAAVEERVGKAEAAKLKKQIVELAGKVFYTKGDPIAGFELYPKLAGNNKIYLFRQMRDILSGVRTNGNTNAMLGIKPFLDTNNITDKELKIIAEYLSTIK